MSTQSKSKAPAMIAYQVESNGEKAYWRRIGAAWKNKAGGYQIRLSAMPIGGELVLLPPREGDTKGAA